MAPRRPPLLRIALIAAAMFAASSLPATAKSLDPKVNSLIAAVDNFIAYLRSETQQNAAAAAEFARDNKHVIDQATSRLAAQIADWRTALSGQKETLQTLGEDASALLKALGETAISSWAKVERHAVDALDWALGWVRQSPSDQRSEIPV